MPAEPPTIEAVLAELAQIRELLDRPAVTPMLLSADDAAAYCGLSRSTMYSLRSADRFPSPVDVPGSYPRWRRADLDAWLAKLRPARRSARP